MIVNVAPDKAEAGCRAAEVGAARLRALLADAGEATIVLATGSSQFEMLETLAAAPDLDWRRVSAFHLDEYVGIDRDHPASFRRYLRERFVERLPIPLAAFHYIDGNTDPEGECRRLGDLIEGKPVDVAFVGIGENGHLAFNDPPADFHAAASFLVVELDEASRRQQLGEGWFPSLGEVPRLAISMSVPRIMSARTIVCTVPEARKAEAVRGAVEGPVTPDLPASILQRHADTHLFLDAESAARLATPRRS